jgi:hypothetical protein
MGISRKKLKKKLEEVNVNILDINHVLVTHSHTDHTAGLDMFPKDNIFTTHQTMEDVLLTNELIPFQTYSINGFSVTVVPTSHDAEGSIGFIIEKDGEKLVYITDTGYLYEKVIDMIKDATYYIFESNHNIRMLIETNRPQSLKKRIMGDYGHLSNDDSAHYLCDVIGESTKEIVLDDIFISRAGLQLPVDSVIKSGAIDNTHEISVSKGLYIIITTSADINIVVLVIIVNILNRYFSSMYFTSFVRVDIYTDVS